MNVFESLIEELKKENLIESDTIETAQSGTDEENFLLNEEEKENANLSSPEAMKPSDTSHSDTPFISLPPANENEFYRRRAVEEVSSLQMVEHILSGVERDQMKIVPKAYDSIAVSKALHEFLQISKNFNSPENASAEFRLMQETETWYTALSYRDVNILPAHLRRYCETTKPVLSAQALAALTRFYRNSPYSESVRSKFDMVVTRLFSVENENDERELAFGYNEIVQHLSELYADWASVSLYATDDDSKILETVRTFDGFIKEAESSDSFEELVRSDFFNRLRAYKEQTGENFYAPSVAAAVIDCNVRVGNVYVRLLLKERRQDHDVNLETKYGFLLDQTISEATSKTLQLTNLLEEKDFSEAEPEEAKENIFEEAIETTATAEPVDPNNRQDGLLAKLLQVNKLILAATFLTILLTAGLYFWSQFSEPSPNREGVQTFSMEGYYFKDYLKVAKITNENLIGIINTNWNDITQEKKQEVLKNMLTVGKEKGFRTVRLQNSEGKTVGYASEDNITASNSN